LFRDQAIEPTAASQSNAQTGKVKTGRLWSPYAKQGAAKTWVTRLDHEMDCAIVATRAALNCLLWTAPYKSYFPKRVFSVCYHGN
jgi:hypothetical protein